MRSYFISMSYCSNTFGGRRTKRTLFNGHNNLLKIGLNEKHE